LPIATVEMQGYLFAARLAMAELLATVGDDAAADRLRRDAAALRARVEERYWLADENFYAIALDGRKRQVASIASNAAHLLWCGVASAERAEAVGRRLLDRELFTGWGLRTLSARHPRYNPLSYQRGSVWPHDTAIAAAGLWRYRQREAAARLLRAILDAALAFEGARLPELFCGFDREHGPPVPYEDANVPQSWAAAVPILAAQLFLGIVPDAPRGRCVIDPWLPEWLPHLTVRGVVVGAGSIDVSLRREGGDTVIERVDARDVDVRQESVDAPLWGAPPA
jgi:glycogen debranching enzyme